MPNVYSWFSCIILIAFVTLSATAVAEPYVCGDADSSQSVDISDAVYLITYIFAGGPEPVPLFAGDASGDTSVDISDAVYLIAYIFAGGSAPICLYPILAEIGPKSVNEGAVLSFGTSASDPYGTIPVLTAVDLPPNASYIDNLNGTGTFNFAPDFTQAGVINMTFIASNGFLADSEVVAITVNNINRPPVLAAIGPRDVDEGSNLSFNTSATDPDGTIPVLTAENLPTNATFADSGNGRGNFNFNPDYTQAGVYNVTFIASDGSLADSEVVAITVNNVNRAPVLAAIGPKSVDEGANLNFNISASDPDATTPVLTAENLPPNATFADSGNGRGNFNFNPDYAQSGVYNVTFIASDGSLADSEVVAITVNNVNRAPVLAAIGPKSVNEGANLNFNISASDPDATTPLLTALNLPPNATFADSGNGRGNFNFAPDCTQAGVINVTFVASDGFLADSEVVAITVIDACGTVTDIDGNVYQTVTIGTQVWMAENLKVTHYRNGDPIPNVTDNGTWGGLTTGAYCNYNNDPGNVATYGRLYNWYAAADSRNLAPTGWHVPTDAEWKQLEMYLGMSQAQADAIGWRGTDEGGKLKEIGTTHWNSPNTGATNESGFSALPGGYRNYVGYFLGMGNYANFWSSTEYDSSGAWNRYLSYYSAQVNRYTYNKQFGFSVRCVRD